MSVEITGQGSRIPTRLAFLLLMIGGGFAIGMISAPGEWYASLDKPFFNPPNWVFGPVWTLLYVLIAMAGWRTWESGRSSIRMALWWGQLFLNFLWSPVFFALQQPWIAMIIVLLMLATIILFVLRSWAVDRVSALLFLPYAAWVGFASVLKLFLAILN
ncbi:MAG: TspO/MBR family protein [Pseudomonadota bacterium]